MPRLRSLVRRIGSDQTGFSLVELLAVAAILVVILAAIVSLMEVMQRTAPKDQERAHQIRDAQVGLHKMTRELRQAYDVKTWSATSMEILVGVGGVEKDYVFDCNEPHPTAAGLKQCVRTEVGTGSKVVLVDRVSSASFAYEFKTGITDPVYARMTVKVPAKGERPDGYRHLVVLDDGFYMRNVDA